MTNDPISTDRNIREYREAVQEVVSFPLRPSPTDETLPVEEVSFDARELQVGLDRMVQARMKLPLSYSEALMLIVFQEMAREGDDRRSSDGS